MSTIDEEIVNIENEIRSTQYNKATEYHIGRLKAKLAKLRREREIRGARGGGGGFAVKKSGNATVAMVGYPSVGKSTILNNITNATSEVGNYDFTTLDIVPGVMEYKGSKIQILDMPGIIIGASKGKGRGREILGVARNSDLVLVMIDAEHYEIDPILRELDQGGIRLNKIPPNIVMSKKDRGGIEINSTVNLTKMDHIMIETILKEYRIVNAELVFRDDVGMDEFIDFLAGNRVYIPGIVVFNKIDLLSHSERKEILKNMPKNLKIVPISAEQRIGLETLKETVFNSLNLIRIYLKPQHKPLETMVIKRGSTIEMLCRAIHKDFIKKFKYALVTGKSVKYAAQRVGLEHMLENDDTVNIVLKVQ